MLLEELFRAASITYNTKKLVLLNVFSVLFCFSYLDRVRQKRAQQQEQAKQGN